MLWRFWVIYQNRRGLGLAFAVHFLHDFPIKMFLIWYYIYGQIFRVIPFFLLKIWNKMCYWVPINGRQGEKEGAMEIQKNEYLGNKMSFLDEIKSIFHCFWRAIIWWENKNLIKIEDTSINFKCPTISTHFRQYQN